MVFVTGATGLLGSHLLYFLLHAGHEVLALRRKKSDIDVVKAVFSQYPEGKELWPRVRWVEGDVLHGETVAGPVRQSEVVFHCAAVVSFTAADKECLQETNLRGTGNIADLCIEHGVRLCYVSSIAALGDALRPGELIDECTPVIEGREHSVYSHSKSEAEQIIWNYIARGLNAVIVCPSIILGAGLWKRSSAQLYFTAARGIPFYTKGVSGYVDVRDVCELMVRLAGDSRLKGERFVLNGGNHSYRHLFTVIARANGKRPPYIYLRPWMTELAWRSLALVGRLTARKMAFTRETARSSQRCSCYSSARILALYPDFHFYTIEETVEHIRLAWITDQDSGMKNEK